MRLRLRKAWTFDTPSLGPVVTWPHTLTPLHHRDQAMLLDQAILEDLANVNARDFSFLSFRVRTPVVSSATRARCNAGLKKRGGVEGKKNARLRIWSAILLNRDMTHSSINLARIEN